MERPTVRIEGTEFRNIEREIEKSTVSITSELLIAALVIFSATVSNASNFEHWLQTAFHFPIAPILSLGSLLIAGFLWLRVALRNRFNK